MPFTYNVALMKFLDRYMWLQENVVFKANKLG